MIYVGPIKRSVTIAGHETSVSLEPLFWDRLRDAAAIRNVPLSALVAQIDADRITAPRPPNLASAIRLWIVADLRAPPGERSPTIADAAVHRNK